MQNIKKSGKKLMLKGIFQVLWGELKTLNRDKLSGLGKILSGYVRMKLQSPKKVERPEVRKIESTSKKDFPLTY